MPVLISHFEEHEGLKYTFRLVSFLSSFVIICALLYKPLQPPKPALRKKPGRSNFQHLLRSLINFDNWKKKKYVIWAVSIPIALTGYFVPYVHMGKFVKESFPDQNENLPIMCIGITSGVGRLLFGYIADFPKVNRILLQQVLILKILSNV